MKLMLKQKINGAIVITFLLIATVFATIQIPFQQHRLQNATQSIILLLHTLVGRDREQLANEIFDSRLKALELRLGHMLKVEGILAIAAFDASGKLMIADGAPLTSIKLTPTDVATAQEQDFIQKKQWQEQAGLLFTHEITFLEESLGFIQIAYSLADVEHEQKNSYWLFASLLIAMFLLMLTVLNYMLSKMILSPISCLQEATQRIARGDMSQAIDISRNDEVGILAQSFEGMRTEINNNISELEKRIFEREQAEGESRRLRNYLSNIIDSMPSVLVVVDSDARVTMWNVAAEQSTNIAAADALGNSLFDVFPQIPLEMEQITESIRDKKIKHHKKKTRYLESGTFHENVTIYPLTADGMEGAVIRIDDVTESVRMEERMVQSEKMLSVGGLAAGMAHEINNPLATMMQIASVMANRLGDKIDTPANRNAAEEAGTTMEVIRDFMKSRGILRMLTSLNESGQRLATIVANMLSFARKSDSVSPHDLARLLDKSLELAATDYDLKKHYDFRKIEITREYEAGLPAVLCEGTMIKQVLLNILRNCGQAMQEAGTRNPRLFVRTLFAEDRKMAVMEIEDNGPGMTEEIRKRIFEPFFTTKPVGEGTGLGLSISYFIITENHRGEMSVVSSPGEGARFIILLPFSGEIPENESHTAA